MSKSIRLHKKYGLNPTMPICVICGKDKGEIVLLGAAYKEEAPRQMIFDIEPCNECKEKYLSKGVLLVESEDGKQPKDPISLAVITDEAFLNIFNSIKVPKEKIAFVEVGLLEKIGAIKKEVKSERKSKENNYKI